ncbi:hypothetical protein [Sphingopyxis sp. MWB1]|uniref:hypothetical protein n=1 Tax=Sphingopyxis sp. MWB1 TaxID=1537715 RepID=UPI000519FDB8|nr:hypothetical protein [Sphingopyxis sp. MWB1]
MKRRDILAAAGVWAALDSADSLIAAPTSASGPTSLPADNGLGTLVDKLGSSTGGEMVSTSRGNSLERELTWARAASPASIEEFYDASNGPAAERMALEAALASGRAVSFRGLLTLDEPLVMPANSSLAGEGASSFDDSRGRSSILRGFAGNEPTITMTSDCQLHNLDVDGALQGTGDGIKVIGTRIIVENVSVRKAGGDNFRIGGDNERLNANGWRISGLRSYAAKGRGFFCHHSNSQVSATFPLGEPDVNGGQMFGGDFLRNRKDNFAIGNAIDNKFFGPMSQESAARNFHFMQGARGNHIYGGYSEAGKKGDLLDSGAFANVILFTQTATDSGFTDADGQNFILPYIRGIERLAMLGSFGIAGVHGSGVGGHLDLYSDTLDLAAQIFGRSTGKGSQGKGVATAKRDLHTPADVFEWQYNAGINILSGGLLVAGDQVVGVRQPAIADASHGNESVKINEILAALRAHGLIDG